MVTRRTSLLIIGRLLKWLAAGAITLLVVNGFNNFNYYRKKTDFLLENLTMFRLNLDKTREFCERYNELSDSERHKYSFALNNCPATSEINGINLARNNALDNIISSVLLLQCQNILPSKIIDEIGEITHQGFILTEKSVLFDVDVCEAKIPPSDNVFNAIKNMSNSILNDRKKPFRWILKSSAPSSCYSYSKDLKTLAYPEG